MIIEFWWKVFLAGVVVAIIFKLFGVKFSGVGIFFIASVCLAVGGFIVLVVSGIIWEKWKNRPKK